MDHFIIPHGKAHLRVPNLTTQAYTTGEGGFAGYPSRMGWEAEHVQGEDAFGQRPREEVHAFFQNWLFFGCAIEVLAIADVKIEQADFLDITGQYVSTRRLPNFLRQWKSNVDKLGGNTYIQWAMKTAIILKRVSNFVDKYCLPYPDHGIRVQRKCRSPVSELTWTSIIALGHTLTEAMISYYDIRRTGNHWGASRLLKRRMLANGWCPMDVERSLVDLGIDGHYYLARMTPNEDSISHEECTKRECTARNVDRDTYKQKHTREDCDCGGAVKADVRAVVGIIEKQGCVPVFHWDPQQKNLCVVSSQMLARGVSEPPYITISHVWSDGLGNLHENALLECQLDRIQHLVDAVFASSAVQGAPRYFWLDTLCVPVGEAMRSVRKLAIRDMADIYKAAAASLVLSSTIEAVSSTDSVVKQSIALYFANWNRRLWTFQEGMLAQVSMMQFADRAVSNNQLVKFSKTSVAEGHCVTFPNLARFEVMRECVHLSDFLRDDAFADLGIMDARFGALTIAIGVLQMRSTSWKSDETICLGTIIGLNLSPLQELEVIMRKEENVPDDECVDDGRLAKRRMEQFLRMVKVFPRDIIFNTSPRLDVDGFRWAPASFLGTAGHIFARDLKGKPVVLDKKVRGLRVYASGLLITTHNYTSEISSAPLLVKLPRKNGSIITFAISLIPVDGDYPPPIAWHADITYGIILQKSIFIASWEAQNDGLSRSCPEDGPELEEWFETLYSPFNNVGVTDAVVGYVKETSDSGIQIQHASLATVTLHNPLSIFKDLSFLEGVKTPDGYESDSAGSEYLAMRSKGSKSDFTIGGLGLDEENEKNRRNIDTPSLPDVTESLHSGSSSNSVAGELSDWGSILEDDDPFEAESAPEKSEAEVSMEALGEYFEKKRWFIV